MDDIVFKIRKEHQNFINWQRNYASEQETESNAFLRELLTTFECLANAPLHNCPPSVQKGHERLQEQELKARHFAIERGSEEEWARRLKRLGVSVADGESLSLKEWDGFLFPKAIPSDSGASITMGHQGFASVQNGAESSNASEVKTKSSEQAIYNN